MTTTDHDEEVRLAANLYGENVATLRTMLCGFNTAADRVQDAAVKEDHQVVFIALFEALSWSVALDERISQNWAPAGKVLGWKWREKANGGDTIAGARFVRNRVHHQWADALRLQSGLRMPLTIPMAFHEWLWIDADQLPSGRQNQGADEYRALLQSQPARNTVLIMGETFRWVIDRLEPSSWVQPRELAQGD